MLGDSTAQQDKPSWIKKKKQLGPLPLQMCWTEDAVDMLAQHSNSIINLTYLELFHLIN